MYTYNRGTENISVIYYIHGILNLNVIDMLIFLSAIFIEFSIFYQNTNFSFQLFIFSNRVSILYTLLAIKVATPRKIWVIKVIFTTDYL